MIGIVHRVLLPAPSLLTHSATQCAYLAGQHQRVRITEQPEVDIQLEAPP
jgi:hypothetical protein